MTYHNARVPCDDCGKKVRDIKLYEYVQRWSERSLKPIQFPIYLCPDCIVKRDAEKRILQFPGELPL